MNYPTSATVELLRKTYPAGTIIECISIDDPYTTIPKGMRGTIMAVDAIGTLDVVWRNGSTLGVAYGAYEVRRVAVPMTIDALNEANGDLVWVVPVDADYRCYYCSINVNDQILLNEDGRCFSFKGVENGKYYVYESGIK